MEGCLNISIICKVSRIQQLQQSLEDKMLACTDKLEESPSACSPPFRFLEGCPHITKRGRPKPVSFPSGGVSSGLRRARTSLFGF